MWRFSRAQVGGRVRDTIALPAAAAGEAADALQEAGFTPCAELIAEADDEEGNQCPPPRADVRGGGILESRAVQSELWSHDQDTDAEVGFVCVQDLMRGVFYAKLAQRESSTLDEDAQRVTKGAITTLIDVAEACSSRKITLGLDNAMAAHTELICSLLYLGFQVMPARKSPLAGIALLLDLDIGWPSPGPNSSQTDNTYTGTSDCSTNALDDGSPDVDSDDSCF